MDKFFIAIYHFFAQRRLVFWIVFSAAFVVSGYFASRIRLEEDITKILPRDDKIEQFNRVFQHSRFLDKLVVTVSLKDSSASAVPDSLIVFCDEYVATLRAQYPGYIRTIQDRADDSLVFQLFSQVSNQLPYYLDPGDYAAIDTALAIPALNKKLADNIRVLGSPAGLALKKMIAGDPVGITLPGLKKLQQLQYDSSFELYDSHILTRDQQHLLLFITPNYPPGNTGKNEQLLAGLDRVGDSLMQRHPGLQVEYFGAPAVSVSNAAQLRKDTLFTQGITVLFLVLFIGFFFRRAMAPVIILVPVVFGALFSLAVMYLLQGTIAVIALGTGSVILGIAVNYSLHVFNHYRHTRSMSRTIGDLSLPLTVGSFTTIGGFLCLRFVQSAMLRDLGLFAAFSLVGASLCSLIFLPQLIATGPASGRDAPRALGWIDRLARWRPGRSRLLLAVLIILTLVFAYTARSVTFEPDMMRMNFINSRLAKADSDLNRINAYSLQSVYVISSGKDQEAALQQNEKAVGLLDSLVAGGMVSKYSGVTPFLLSREARRQKIARWKAFWTPGKREDVMARLRSAGAPLGYAPHAFDAFDTLISKAYLPVADSGIDYIRQRFLDDYLIATPGRYSVITLARVTPAGREKLYRAFEGIKATTVVDKQYLTGRLVQLVNNDFGSIAIMSSLLVFIVLLLSYGRIELTLVSFVPMFISWIWILGIMALLGVTFNIVNIIISALIFGLGDDYSLYVMDGLLQEYKTGKKNLGSYRSSIFLSAITTVAGLGVLVFAKHPALRSIAVIAIIGILCVVVIGQLLIPYLFSFLVTDRIRKNRFPWTFSGILKSGFAFTYFATGSVFVAGAAVLFVHLNPFDQEKGKLIYHRFLSLFVKSLLYIMPNVKKRFINPVGEDFSRPAVIIANHQSSLDVLIAMMLHPKIILFINRRVWHLPFVGFIVRSADYFPTTENTEEGLDKIRARVKQGYSVLVFPEGTRSENGQLHRFHKGAFYVAEKLQLDIIPLLIHGTAYALSKDDFLLKDGRITVSILPRIRPGDESFGEGYAARTRAISRYFKASFETLRHEIEQPAYFFEQLKYNYIYKGPVLEWYLRIKVKLEKCYQVFHQLLPEKGHILDIGCGYGFMAYLLHFAAPGRKFTALDYDEEKIAVAAHCFSRTGAIGFVAEDITTYHFGQYDAVVLMDVLHYLLPEQQEEVIRRSIRATAPGGVVIIRDGNTDLQQRQRGTALTELFSTAVFGFNKTEGHGLNFLSGRLIRDLAAAQGMECTEIDNSTFTSNIIFVLKHVRVHEQV